MIGVLRAIGERGEEALRRGVLSLAGAGLVVIAAGFAAAALVEALALIMPRGAALGAAALTLLIAGALCLSRAAKKQHATDEKPGPAAHHALAAAESGDWKRALNLALVEEARERPARAAALAALAGLILGALEGFEEAGRNKD